MKRHFCWLDSACGRYVLQEKELHCGDCFQVQIADQWHDVRIEHGGGGWFLVGVPAGHSTAPASFEARLYKDQP